MAINVSQAFHRTSANPVDDTMTLTMAQMLAVNDNLMPSYYFTVCQDDGFIYLYDKSATPSVETGKFTKFEGGGGGTGGDARILTSTMLAASWTSGSQTVTVTGLKATDNGVIGLLNTATDAQIEAARDAVITVSTIAANAVTLACENEPSIDIPFGILLGGGSGDAPSDPTKADLTTIAPAFDATATYAEGDVVTYNGKAYIFTDEHTGEWDSADVDETDVSELTEEMSAAEVQAVKDAYDSTALQTGAFASTFDIIDLRGTERIVGKLIEPDGTEKVLYEKTVDFGALPNATVKSVNHNINNIDLIVSVTGIAGPQNYLPLPFVNTDTSDRGVQLFANATTITIRTSTNASSYTETYITLRYTKTA